MLKKKNTKGPWEETNLYKSSNSREITLYIVERMGLVITSDITPKPFFFPQLETYPPSTTTTPLLFPNPLT